MICPYRSYDSYETYPGGGDERIRHTRYEQCYLDECPLYIPGSRCIRVEAETPVDLKR